MSRKIRVMFAMGGSMKRAGAETMIMQYLRQLVKNPTFEFSILVHGDEKGDYDDEIRSMGVPIYHAPIRGQYPFTYSRSVANILSEHPVDIIHCNMDNSSGYFLKIAKQCGIKVRIAHSHTTRILATNPIKKIIGKISKWQIHNVATHRLACSKKAGDWLFGQDKYRIINNAIDLDSYRFNPEIRTRVREKLGLAENTLAVCHIGSFTYPKNHEGLLHIFRALKEERPNSKLILAGVGPLMEQTKEQAGRMNLKDDIVFLGLCKDIPALLQAADVYVMPSLMEGLPVSGIEAQAAGIPCFFSDTITPEICMTKTAKQLPLHATDVWISELKNVQFYRDYAASYNSLTKRGYNIKNETSVLEDFYKNLLLL